MLEIPKMELQLRSHKKHDQPTTANQSCVLQIPIPYYLGFVALIIQDIIFMYILKKKRNHAPNIFSKFDLLKEIVIVFM